MIKNKLFIKLRSAFTLLELLVVIGIIAVLVSIGTISYSSAQKKARDAQRRADLHLAQNAMEQCYSTQTTNKFQYPTISNNSGTLSASCDGVLIFSITDPKNSGSNVYSVADSDADSYTITATLEIGSTSISVSNQQ